MHCSCLCLVLYVSASPSHVDSCCGSEEMFVLQIKTGIGTKDSVHHQRNTQLITKRLSSVPKESIGGRVFPDPFSSLSFESRLENS